MSTATETIINKRTGDTPTNVPGEVNPGMLLRERMGIKAKEAPKDVKEPDVKKPKAIKKPAPAQAPLDQSAITAAATTAAVAAVGAMTKKEEKPAPVATETDGLTPDQIKKYNVLKHMGTLNTANASKAAAFATGIKKLAEYQATWEKEHKGEKFNADTPEHEEFFAANDVNYNPDDYIEALADLKAEERSKNALKPIEERLKGEADARELERKLEEVRPVAAAAARSCARTFFNKLGDEFKDILDANNVLNPSVEKAIAETNDAYPIIANAARSVETVASELKRIATRAVSMRLDPPKELPQNASAEQAKRHAREQAEYNLHMGLFQFVVSQENAVKQLPADEQIVDGKQFATSIEWGKMSADDRRKHWHLSDDDLAAIYTEEMAKTVKETIKVEEEKFQNRAKKRGLIGSEAKNPASQPVVRAANPAPVQRREDAPEGNVMPRVAPQNNSRQTHGKSLFSRPAGR